MCDGFYRYQLIHVFVCVNLFLSSLNRTTPIHFKVPLLKVVPDLTNQELFITKFSLSLRFIFKTFSLSSFVFLTKLFFSVVPYTFQIRKLIIDYSEDILDSIKETIVQTIF